MGNSKVFFLLFVDEKRIQFISNMSSMSLMHHGGVSIYLYIGHFSAYLCVTSFNFATS